MMKDIARIVGSRIAGRPSYTPGYSVPGVEKAVSAKIEFNVYKNGRGLNGKKIPYKCTAWGGMADAIARGAAVGKEFTFDAEIKKYRGRIWIQQPNNTTQFVTNVDGTPHEEWKDGYTIEAIHWGNDSDKCIANEIAAGMRPLNWDRPGTPDHTAWLQICANRNAAQYVHGAPTFEYADVVLKHVPAGAIITPPRVAKNAVQPAAQPQQAYVAPVAQATPVVVNGQNMGYQMPTAQPVAQAAAQPVHQAYVAPVANPALPTHDANGQPIQYAANPAAVAQAMPAAQPVAQVNTGYAQPVAAAQPGAYSPVVM